MAVKLNTYGHFKAGALTLLLILSVFPTVLAQVSLELQPRQITVGDPIELILKTQPPEGVKVIWPTAEAFAPAEIIKADTLRLSGRELGIRYIISLFEAGRIALPDLPVVYNRPEGPDTIWTKAGAILVKSVLSSADTTSLELKDVHPPVRLGWTLADLAPYLIALVIIIAIAAAAWWLWRRYKRLSGEIPAYVPSPLPPHVTALNRLEELRLKKLWQNGYLKEYYSELTDIIKEYIGGRFNFIAPEMTTEELLEGRSRWAPDDERYLLIRRILTCGDLVKFAKFKPAPSENDRCWGAGFAYVEATKYQSDQPLVESVTQASSSGG
ncbi:MAG: hypothetical protein V2A61_01985 [Calditrichota bacterium]